ncbi:sterol O-acyltransferase 2 [[Candida] jaroonii]|uniref:Sterol O-acyltransferase 2 n=1 Tax=[Candida] jaroonii TaxID=467808 RepID=A0ACA9YFZ5_9ASCO|nr:sterol O-acyltransferase 2 [[Candida] jaroonii]
MRRSSTGQNLSIITDRNSGRRRSLYDDRLLEDSNDEIDRLKSKVRKGKVNSQESELLPIETIKSKIDDLDRNHQRTRLRKKKTHDKDKEKKDIQPESEEPEYRSHFGDIKFLETSTSIFDSSQFKESQFFGIYILFWLGTAFLIANNIMHAYLSNGKLFWQFEIVGILTRDIFKVALTDLIMYLTTYFAFGLQKMCAYGYINWQSTGWLLQASYDFFYLLFWTFFASPHFYGFPWIARVFLLLHSLVFLMKMHSYGFYNGYLWRITEELEFSEKYLKRCEDGDESLSEPDKTKIRETLVASINFCKFELEQQSKTNFHCKDPNVLAETPPVNFPENITLFNWYEFTMFPTLVYTLNFPRTKQIRWKFVGEKVLAVFGIFVLMIIIAQNGMYPLVMVAKQSKKLPMITKIQTYLLVLMDMIPHFLLQYLFTFFIIWEFILNTIAELSRFADRDFYGPWWSCTDWGEFARIWNRPVHKFLLRHVYHSSISTIRLSKIQASLFTFVLSSLVHELVMFCIFRTFRGYLLLFQLSQIPLMMISNTRFMRDKKVLGNCICWIGFISGPSIICTLYLFF